MHFHCLTECEVQSTYGLVSRLLTGFSGGAFFFVAPIYVMETSEPQIRGQLAALAMTMAPLGLAFTNGLSIEDAVHWNAISAILIAVPGD